MRAPRERAERAPLDEPVSRAEPIAQERLLALQRSAGNASVGRLLQRYRRVEPTGYTPPTGGTPFNLASPNIDLMPRPDDKPGLGIGWPGATPAHPPLHVANDNSLAINAQAGEPKEFYARADVLTNANTQLDAVKSPIELHPAGSPLTVTGVPTPLQQAQPRLRGKPPPQAGRFAELVADICREVAKQIIGGRISHARLDDRLVPINAQNSKVVSGTHELAHALSAGGAVSKDAAATAMQRGDRPASGKTYGEASQAGTTAASAAALGINEHARARIGEAYVTQTIANPEGHSEEQDFSRGGMEHATVWGYHFGAVVAESLDGVDQITLENYRRDDEIQKGAAALLERLKRDFAGQLADLAGETTSEQLGRALRKIDGKLETTREEALAAYIDLVRERIASEAELWYFRMVGGDPGQSFHEQMAQSNAFANPLTMAVTGSSEPATITFNDGESTLSQVAQNVLRGFARNYAADPHRARVRSIRVVGACPELYFESRRHTLARARADAAVNFLTPLGVPPTLFDVQTDATVYPDWEKSSRRKVECIPVR
jgi:outer membrane protein OmpA-like peptidoglycan-associated protein